MDGLDLALGPQRKAPWAAAKGPEYPVKPTCAPHLPMARSLGKSTALKCSPATDCKLRASKNLRLETRLPFSGGGPLQRHRPQHRFPLIFHTMTNLSNTAAMNTELEREVAALLVSALNLEVAPEEIEADADLYGDGLGLDSIDILEIALVVSKQYGIQMKTEGDDNFQIFKSLRSLSAYIADKRTK